MGVLCQPRVKLKLVGNVHKNASKFLEPVIILRKGLSQNVGGLLGRDYEVDRNEKAKVAVTYELLPEFPVASTG